MTEPQHRSITVTVLDTETGDTRTDSTGTPWYWAYGNGDCDCNRGALFGNDEECDERRYYIVAVNGDESGYEIGEDYNHGYPPLPRPLESTDDF
jgi:hypothetical protein